MATRRITNAKAKRPERGRGLFYTRDSSGRHETTPSEYVRWAAAWYGREGVRFGGTPKQIDGMIKDGTDVGGDLFLDWNVSGNKFSRRGLEALLAEIERDRTVSHVAIPRRDRLVRPNDVEDGLRLETRLRRMGVTLVYRDRVCKPLGPGERAELGESLQSAIEFDKAGRDRLELADKTLTSHRNLASQGFSTGGRAKYGLERWLIHDGKVERALVHGENVRGKGYHVIWLPKTDGTYEVRLRVKRLLKKKTASEIARLLTAEDVPPPDAGRTRRDVGGGGGTGTGHVTSGVWHATTIAAIGRDTIDAGSKVYGRRSMGDQLRFGPDGPRPMEEEDYREGVVDQDGKRVPKVVHNPPASLVVGPAHFEAKFSPQEQAELTAILDARAGSQRGKPRSRSPDLNPLGGGRIVDVACAWPMYRAPNGDSFKYVCGFYNQSHGACCEHNTIDGPTALRFGLACVRQRALSPERMAAVRRRLEEMAAAERADDGAGRRAQAARDSVKLLEKEERVVGANLSRATSAAQFARVSAEYDSILAALAKAREDLGAAERECGAGTDWRAEVDAAVAVLEGMGGSCASACEGDFAAARELFDTLNVRLFLRFGEGRWGKRKVRKVAGGVLTIGNAPSPVEVYAGPTDRRRLKQMIASAASAAATPGEVDSPGQLFNGPGLEGDSLGNVSRGDKIRTCDLLDPNESTSRPAPAETPVESGCFART